MDSETSKGKIESSGLGPDIHQDKVLGSGLGVGLRREMILVSRI